MRFAVSAQQLAGWSWVLPGTQPAGRRQELREIEVKRADISFVFSS
jgi:hypothetical protein